jgi:chorismate-pyruvate lyase
MVPLILAAALAVAHGWPDTPLGRAEAMAAIQGLNVELLTHDSATATLEAWCASHRLAEKPSIVARRIKGQDKPADAEVRAALGVGPDEPVRYRRVDLACGDKVLSQADNWYLPGRLTPEMNRVLDSGDTPFGRAVAALDFRRRTLSSRLIDPPLRPGWEMEPPAPARRAGLRLPPDLLQHRAVLSTPDGRPFSLVVETYRREVLGFR